MGRRRRRKKRRWFRVLLVFLAAALAAGLASVSKLHETKLGAALTGLFAPEIPYQEVSLSEKDLMGKYYYGQLEKEEQTVYREIAQGLTDHEEEIYVHADNAKRTFRIFSYVLKDSPEMFWCNGTAQTTSYEGSESYTVLEPVYTCGLSERERRQKKIDRRVKKCLAGIDPSASDYEKILYVFDYIVDTVEYDAKATDNQNIYSVFVNRHSVCAGYSKSTQYLLERLGVFCTYVTGTVKNGESHAWNLVKCNDSYCYVDTTWGDPVFLGEEEARERDYVSYDYMCCSDAELLKTHRPDPDTELPACTDMSYNYYVVNDMYYETYDSGKVLDAMNRTIRAGENPSVFKFADSEAYSEAHGDILEHVIGCAAQTLAEQYGLSRVRYSYMDNQELNKIVIYWSYS